MSDFREIYSMLKFENIEDNFFNLTTYEQKKHIDCLIRQFLKGKICYKKGVYLYDDNKSTIDLVKEASFLFDKEAIFDLSHFILNLMGNMQGWTIDWLCNENLNGERIQFAKNDDGKWNRLSTEEDVDAVVVFEYIYDKFQNEFLKEFSHNNIFNNFLRYIKIPTNSDSKSKEVPSTENQFKLASILEHQLKCLGVDECIYDKEQCYVYAKIKGDPNIPSVGFISHMDTSEDVKDNPILPLTINNYNGKDIVYSANSILKVDDNPDLLNHVGKTLIMTDGNTLLGADDKAGIAEIMGMVEYFKTNSCNHGDIYVVFTPDEEIGKSTNFLNRNIFNPQYAYTVDGSDLGEISYENFNAADVFIEINGVETHPGFAKDKMVNALLLANMINELLPKEEIPANTEMYEGFYHLHKMSGDITHVEMFYLIRDFDRENYYNRIEVLKSIVDKLNEKYNNCINIKINARYKNMYSVIKDNMEVIDMGLKAMEKLGITSKVVPIRGGTDGTRLSQLGIPCPNLGTGGHNFHSKQEYIALDDMEKVRDILVGIVKEYYLTYKNEKNVYKVKNKIINI